jgi:bacillithiol system protein YtxJ
MNWTPLTDIAQLDAIDNASQTKPVLLFKHSTTCSISRTALDRLERAWTLVDDEGHSAYYLDLLKFRSVSDAIAERYGVTHESPQALIIQNGRSVHDSSHFGITYPGVIGELKKS